jgi:hypothetical protein
MLRLRVDASLHQQVLKESPLVVRCPGTHGKRFARGSIIPKDAVRYLSQNGIPEPVIRSW